VKTETYRKIKAQLERQQDGRVTNLTLKDLPSPSLLKNNIEAGKEIIHRLEKNQKLLIVGDYDADGIFATTILVRFFKDIGYDVKQIEDATGKEDILYIVPDRLKDGYGLSTNIINKAKEANIDFIVTVDNGISANEAVELSNSYNIPVIITDHHTAPKVLPNALYIVNPKQPNETFPFIEISGATVAWYLIAGIKQTFSDHKAISNIHLLNYIDFVALTVISDVMPLTDINIAIFKKGLEIIKLRRREVYRLAWNEWSIPVLDSVDLAFTFIPKINAMGRINDANKAVKLFVSQDITEIGKLWKEFNETNQKRQMMTKEAIKKAVDIVNKDNLQKKKVIVIQGSEEEFHEGIVGIIAGKLAELYKRPSYVFAQKGDILKGSGRSVGDVHLYNLTSKAKKHMLGFGGHKGAIGGAVDKNKWNDFVKALEEGAKDFTEEIFEDNIHKVVDVDLSEIDQDVVELIKKYEPFGELNPSLVLHSKVDDVRILRIMNDLHLKLEIIKDGKSFTGLLFNVDVKFWINAINNKGISEIDFYLKETYNPRDDSFGFELFLRTL
jgi:single-stranded-DNA-specific exonuclease